MHAHSYTHAHTHVQEIEIKKERGGVSEREGEQEVKTYLIEFRRDKMGVKSDICRSA